jgi:hypothetical protein
MIPRPLVLCAAVLIVAGCVAPSGTSSPPVPTVVADGPAATLAPSPAGSVAPTTNPSSALSWERIGAIPSQGTSATGTVSDIVGFAAGYVAITVTRTVWFSADGHQWTAIVLPFAASKDKTGNRLDAAADDVATDGTSLLLVGGYAHGPCLGSPPGPAGAGPLCPRAPLAWISTDGRSWASAFPGPRPPDPPGDSQGGEFTAAWSVPSGGWDSALSFWNGESLAGRDVWHSSDGLTWTALHKAPARAGADARTFPLVHEGVADATGRRVLWQGGSDDVNGQSWPVTTLASSPDGLTWATLDGFLGKDAEVDAGMAPAAGRAPRWVLVGGIISRDLSIDQLTGTPTVWTSEDVTHWTSISLPNATDSRVWDVSSLVLASRGYVAVGTRYDGLASDHETWVSDDGTTWTLVDPSAAPGLQFGPQHLADGPAGVLGIGDDGSGASVVWSLRTR